jgi:hypothetical protein
MQFTKLFTFGSRKNTRRVVAGLLMLLIILMPIQNILGTPTVSVAHADSDFCSGGGSHPVSDCLSGIVYLFAVYLPTNFAYATGYLFNMSLQIALNSVSYALNFLSIGWTIVRDIANLSFIFILIYIAYTIIMRAETTGTMKTLAMVIAMALLINFSFFLTRIVIDAGNILAVQFYNAIPVDATVPSPLTSPSNPTYVKDLTSGIMDAVKVQGILSDSSFTIWRNQNGGANGQNDSFWGNLGLLSLVFVSVGIFVSILGFVFLIVGIKFIVRIVVLWLTIIASPLAFAAQAVPNKTVKGYYKMWQDNLVQSSFYPGVFLFLFLIMTYLLKALAGDKGIVPDIFAQANALANAPANSQAAVVGVISIIANITIRMGLVTVLLYFAMKASDAVSSMGSGIANSVVSWAGGAASSVTSRAARVGIGTTAWAGRNTIGRGANAASRSATIQNLAANKWYGRPIKAGLESAAKGSYDVRGVPGVKSTLESVNKIPGANKLGLNLSLGKAGTDSIRKQFDRRAKNIEERAKELGHDAVDTQKAIPESPAILRSEQIKLEAEKAATQARKSAAAIEKAEHDDLAAGARKMGLTAVAESHATESSNRAKELKELQKTSEKLEKSLAENQKNQTDPAAMRKYTDNRLKELDKERKESLAQRLESGLFGNSRGTMYGVAKIRGGSKTKTQEALEHLEHAVHEDAAGAHGGDAHGGDHGNDGGHHPPPPPPPKKPSGGTPTPPAGDAHHDDHHHLELKTIRTSAQKPGGLQGSTSKLHDEVFSDDILKRLDMRMKNLQESASTQNKQASSVQESLNKLSRTVGRQGSAQPIQTTAKQSSLGSGVIGTGVKRPTTETRVVSGADGGRDRRMPVDKGSQGAQGRVNELADSITLRTSPTPTPPPTPQIPPAPAAPAPQVPPTPPQNPPHTDDTQKAV